MIKKQLLLSVCILMILFSCKETSKKDSDLNAEMEHIMAEQESNSIDTSTPQKFIEAFSELRKKAHAETENYRINSDLVLSQPGFFIINFTERLENYTYSYCIVINPNEKNTNNGDLQNVYDEVNMLLEEQQLNFNLFTGKLEATKDLTNDGSPDFILTHENSYRTSFSKTARLILFDGKTGLTPTYIIANSDFTAGECPDFIGIKEELLIPDDTPGTIIISREENKSETGDCNADELIKLRYQKVWVFDNGVLRSRYLLNTPGLNASESFQNFPKKFAFIEEKEESYVVMENCQNGGANTYELTGYNNSEATNITVLGGTSDNVESFFLAGFKAIDSLTTKLYWRPTESMDFGDDFDAIEEYGLLNSVLVKRDTLHTDRYVFFFSELPTPATIQPDKYPFVACEQ